MTEYSPASQLLRQWRAGDEDAGAALMDLVYNQLRSLAGHYLKGERPNHSLGATALVHEAYLRLASADVDFQNRAHFLALAGRLMRRILVDHARARGRGKRSAQKQPLDIEKLAVAADQPHPALLDLDDALSRLQQLDGRKAHVVELIYFGGLSYDEAAAVLEVSPATLHRELKNGARLVVQRTEIIRLNPWEHNWCPTGIA